MNRAQQTNALSSTPKSPYDPKKAGHYLQCYEQTDYVIEKLRELSSLDENRKWSFDSVNNNIGTHTWGRAQSKNPNDPTIYFDPYWDNITSSDCHCNKFHCSACQP